MSLPESTAATAAPLTVPSLPASVGRIRRHALAVCREGGFTGDLDVVALLTSEVATNALLHGSGDVRVVVTMSGGRLRVEVTDDSDDVPRPRRAGPDAEGGRGLALVEALAADWGVLEHDGVEGKTVFFEVAGAGL